MTTPIKTDITHYLNCFNFNDDEFIKVNTFLENKPYEFKISFLKSTLETQLTAFNITDYTLSSDGIRVTQSVNLSHQNLSSLPLNFVHVKGDFDVSHNQLTSFKGFPTFIEGSLNCSHNQISHFDDFPHVSANIDCSHNYLKEINLVSDNQEFHSICDFSHNLITEAKFYHIGQFLNLSYNQIKSLLDVGHVGRGLELDVSHNLITDFSFSTANLFNSKFFKINASDNPIQYNDFDSCIIDHTTLNTIEEKNDFVNQMYKSSIKNNKLFSFNHEDLVFDSFHKKLTIQCHLLQNSFSITIDEKDICLHLDEKLNSYLEKINSFIYTHKSYLEGMFNQYYVNYVFSQIRGIKSPKKQFKYFDLLDEFIQKDTSIIEKVDFYQSLLINIEKIKNSFVNKMMAVYYQKQFYGFSSHEQYIAYLKRAKKTSEYIKEVKKWLKLRYKKKDYYLNYDVINLSKNVYLNDLNLKSIPFNFKHVKGNFYCQNNQLTHVQGVAEIIIGNFDCSFNQIINFNSFPTRSFNINCSHNCIQSNYEGSIEDVDSLDCSFNSIDSFHLFMTHSSYKGLNLSSNKITYLDVNLDVHHINLINNDICFIEEQFVWKLRKNQEIAINLSLNPIIEEVFLVCNDTALAQAYEKQRKNLFIHENAQNKPKKRIKI